MFKVVWIDVDGEEKTVRGFKTSEDAHDWIESYNFQEDEFPMVFGDVCE